MHFKGVKGLHCTAPPPAGALLQVEWLRERIGAIPVRLVFESALELMGTTQIGSFQVRLLLTSQLSHSHEHFQITGNAVAH